MESHSELFLHPTPEFSPANYWFWQRIPTREEIDNQLNEMLKAGYRTFYIQPRLAFPIEQYLSDEYLATYRYAIERAHFLGLKAGIYDDYNWNSGHAAGLTVKGHDEFRERQLFWTSTSIQSTSFTLEISEIKTLMGDTLGGPQGRWTYEGGKPFWAEWQLVRVVGYPEDAELVEDTELVDLGRYCIISRPEKDHCEIEVVLPDDRYRGLRMTVFVSGLCITSRHINYLSQDATDRFIEVGYEPYKKAVGDFFGSTIFCMFMDHPHAGFYTWQQIEGNIQNTLMYDSALVKAFETERGYPIEVAWLSFLLPESRLTAKFRGDFFDTYGTLARKNFLGKVSGWARQNGLQFAGHELFGFLGIWGFYGGYHVVDQRTDFGGDYFGIGRHKDISTVDAFNSNPQIDAKIGDSVARANGSRGCLLEQYYFSTDPSVPGAIGHWNLTFDEMRSQALRHTFFGTKQYIFHGFYLTDKAGKYELLASSRFDFAPGINYEPWFAHHAVFANELSRLSTFIYDSQPLTDIAVMYPLSTFWVEGTDGVFGDHSAIWNQWLLENGFGFDIVDENRLSFDPKFSGRIHFGINSYRILILPGVTVIRNSKLISDIVDFVRSGGILLLSGALPNSTVEGGTTPDVLSTFNELIKNNSTVHYFPSQEELRPSLAVLMAPLLPTRPRVIPPEESPKQIWSWTGQDDLGYRIALFNDSDTQERVIIEIPREDAIPEKWDLCTGERSKWLWYDRTKQETRALVDLKPREVACFRMDCSGAMSDQFHLTEIPLQVVDAREIGKTASAIILAIQPGAYQVKWSSGGGKQGNVAKSAEITINIPAIPEYLVLNGEWNLTIPEKAEKAGVHLDSGWEVQGFEDYAGEGIYETTFDISNATPDWQKWTWKLAFPQVFTSAEIKLNDQPIGVLPWPPYELILPNELLRSHDNRLAVKVYNSAGNFYYAGSPYAVAKAPSGIVGFPILKPCKLIKMTEKGRAEEIS